MLFLTLLTNISVAMIFIENEGVNDPYNINQFGIAFRCKVTNLGQTSLCDNGNIITVKSVYQNSNGNNESMTSTVIDER